MHLDKFGHNLSLRTSRGERGGTYDAAKRDNDFVQNIFPILKGNFHLFIP
jgi:hypothetical protein